MGSTRFEFMKTPTKPAPKQFQEQPFVGTFFHSLDEQKHIEWQGRVVGSPEPGLYLVQLFEWGMGDPSVQQIVGIHDMRDWLFYATAEEMKQSYDYGHARRGGKHRP